MGQKLRTIITTRPLRAIIISWLLLTMLGAVVAWKCGFQLRWIAFWGVAFFLSLLHAIPGWAYGLYSFSGAFEHRKQQADAWTRAISIDGEPTQFWKHVYALPQALTYFVSSLAGAAALFVLLKNYPSLMAEISASKAAVFIALFFFAITGLSGALGRILTQLKGFPRIGGG
jgi:hypothetical protein